MIDLPYILTNLRQNKQMKLKNKGVVENPKSDTSCNELVITPSRELQIQLCKIYWKANIIIFPTVYSLHINSGSINTIFIPNLTFLHLIQILYLAAQ